MLSHHQLLSLWCDCCGCGDWRWQQWWLLLAQFNHRKFGILCFIRWVRFTHSIRWMCDTSTNIEVKCIRSIIYCPSINQSGVHTLSRCVNFFNAKNRWERNIIIATKNKCHHQSYILTHSNPIIQLKSAVSALKPHTCNKTLHSVPQQIHFPCSSFGQSSLSISINDFFGESICVCVRPSVDAWFVSHRSDTELSHSFRQ